MCRTWNNTSMASECICISCLSWNAQSMNSVFVVYERPW
jgi:hypothetical protein